MALTRKMLREMGLSEEAIETVIDAHTQTVDALKGYEAEARRLASVQQELEEMRAANGESLARYERERDAFAQYRAQVQAREETAQRAALYRAALKSAGVKESLHEQIVEMTNLSQLGVKDGRLADEAAVIQDIRAKYEDFIPATTTTGTLVETPPANAGAGMTREQIMGIRDAAQRQRAIGANIGLFR